MDAARPVFRTRTALALVLVSLFAFSAFVTLLGLRAGPGSRRRLPRPTSIPTAPSASRASAELVRQDGAPMVVSRSTLPKAAAKAC